MAMTFKEAAAFVMPYGINKGRKLDDIATTDLGLLYLDWLRGERGSDAFSTSSRVNDALIAYLDDPTIAADVAKLAKGKA